MEFIVGAINTGNMKMDYCRFGDGERVFVILPGISIKPVIPSAEAISNGFSAFCKDFTVYLFDRRSDIPPQYSIEDMADDTVLAMLELGIKKADFFGASQGGMIAQAIAIRHPGIVNKLVLGSTSCDMNAMFFGVVSNWLNLAKSQKGKELNEVFCRDIYSPSVFEANKENIAAMGEAVNEADMARFAVLAEAILKWNCRPLVKSICQPTLILGSAGDAVATGEASVELARILGCELYMYPENYGHAVFDEAADYRMRIKTFLLGR